MNLKIATPSPEIPLATAHLVSLQNNGVTLRLLSWERKCVVCVIHRPEFRFYTNDAETTVEVTGYIFNEHLQEWKLVSLTLE